VFSSVLFILAVTGTPYSCTGHFQTDFMELCRRVWPPFVHTPKVLLRPHALRSPVALSAHVVEEKTPKTSKSSKKEEQDKTETPVKPEYAGRCSLQTTENFTRSDSHYVFD